MILLGLLLVLACTAMAVDAVVQNGHVLHATAFNQPIDHLTLGGIFIAGAVLGIVFALGVLLITGGLGRSRRRRAERIAALRESSADSEALRKHNERLERELEDQRATDTSYDTAYPDEASTGTPAGDGRRSAFMGGRHRARSN
jgi:hypothetical protein